jgi:hypothetical protein
VLVRAWETYIANRLVFGQPHVVVRDAEDGGKPRFVEIFTWINRATPEHPPESVLTVWKQEQSLCEQRGGHYEIEPGEVKLIVPSAR